MEIVKVSEFETDVKTVWDLLLDNETIFTISYETSGNYIKGLQLALDKES